VQDALSKDDLATAKASAAAFEKSLDDVDAGLLNEMTRNAWRDEVAAAGKTAHALSGAEDLTKAREAFAPLSDSVYAVAKRFGSSGAQAILRFHCPMAFDGAGAYWLQDHDDAANPYFGAAMLQCSDSKEIIAAGAMKHEGHGHE